MMFITFEGPDGSGKTTQVKLLADYLKKQGYQVIVTREPGGTPIGDQIRNVLFNLKNTDMHPRTEILLFQASRAQHVERLIKPSIEKRFIVLCDRFADSTIAYQGYGHQVDLKQIHAIVNFATGGLKPDLTLLFDIDVKEGLRRRDRGGDWNRMDAYQLGFHQRVRDGYHHLVQEEPERWVVINAEQPPDVVQAVVQKIVLERLKNSPS